MRLRRHIFLLAVLALADCGSSPKTHFFTLSVAPRSSAERLSISSPVTVAAVHVPPSLDRRAMVRRTGANTVEISDQDRWTTSLGDMARRILSQDLAARLPREKVVPPDAPAPPHTAQIVVAVEQFWPDADGRVALDCSWSLLDAESDRPVLVRNVTLRTDAAARSADEQAAAMSELLGELANRIAATLTHSHR